MSQAAGVCQLDARQRIVLMHGVAHRSQILDVTVVPELGADHRQDIAMGYDHAHLGEDRTPAAFGFHATKRRLHSRLVDSGTVAVGHLPEAVSQHLWPELDRLEKDVVFRISCHGVPPCVFRLG